MISQEDKLFTVPDFHEYFQPKLQPPKIRVHWQKLRVPKRPSMDRAMHTYVLFSFKLFQGLSQWRND